MEFQDRILRCVDCATEFIWTAGEQQFFADKNFKNEPKRFVFQGVHMILDGDVQRPWKSDEPRKSRIVFIGRNLKEDELRQGFLACAA